jgi:membrane associated rhomboid family serine protease
MGLYDRDYASGHEPGFHFQAPKTITTQLVLITAVAYGLQLIVNGFTNWFSLNDNWYRQPWEFYRLLTYGFLHDPRDFKHILVNMFIFWMFGRELEQKYGRREFTLLYLWAITFAGLVWSMSEATYAGNASLMGASGGVAGIVALYALCFPHRKVLLFFLIPMPMWLAATIGLLWDLKIAMTRSGNIAGIAHLAGALCGLYYYKFGFSPFLWIANRFSGVKLPRKSKLRLHNPSSSYKTKADSEIDEIVDEILKKIKEQGQDSLTRRERRILEKASQKYQRKRP